MTEGEPIGCLVPEIEPRYHGLMKPKAPANHQYLDRLLAMVDGGVVQPNLGPIVLPEPPASAPAPVIDKTNPKDLIGLTKVALRLVPSALEVFAAFVYKLGAAKYGAFNWRKNNVRRTVYLEAAMRHLKAVMDGEDTDPESGAPHEAHVVACMGIILDALVTGNLIDDRPPPGKTAWLINVTSNTTPVQLAELVKKLTFDATEKFRA